MKYKVTVEELRNTYDEKERIGKPEMQEVLVTVSEDPKVIAGTLRALADKYDPPKPNYRGV